MLINILIGILVNAIIGAGVCATLDTEDKIFFNWYKDDPTPLGIGGFLILEFWPIMAFFMIRYKQHDRSNPCPK